MPRPSSFSSSSSFVAIWQTWIYFNLAKDLRALLRAYFFNLLLNNFFLSLSCLLTVIHLTLSYLGEKKQPNIGNFGLIRQKNGTLRATSFIFSLALAPFSRKWKKYRSELSGLSTQLGKKLWWEFKKMLKLV